ncbi:MAG: DNA methylase [Ignavibacteria bacterium RIFOXYB2_FULL_35_12]|nr:MAG: DNA methylase [Ignavibacteria bacterium GWF2_35_20]OGU82984.1 MAG: DNA methylase [Ignavibacteria bacterium RIFOXYA2_FULL_35_9]OGU88394.1 MAG: DNA methylase [Ignavibacteria bacterium RIFOXYC12_FULL_35_11]OGU91535.1 MAG: DNA methylase [Ignavibacteria bacterium RIFOXYA12_FULL_35_25]OGU97921.1 MAG: DNA methylase [Ignavibacteria bacterium RIFOXYB12_FULL_35_14]OGU98625.1 MAG: DNA methylase [Ignavibacteria bacterium RIFOXYC2_FULL_35_16]OGV04367.1 MAG: DNA methylase [Ignavibacteria bacterium 
MPRNKIIPYNPVLRDLARNLRKESTLSEILLWKEIKTKQILGYQFHRQVPIDNYIADFFCHELFLAIEIDGISHALKETYDEKRQQRLESLGVRFLRFDDLEVKFQMESVLSRIKEWINAYTQNSQTSPSPPSKGD